MCTELYAYLQSFVEIDSQMLYTKDFTSEVRILERKNVLPLMGITVSYDMRPGSFVINFCLTGHRGTTVEFHFNVSSFKEMAECVDDFMQVCSLRVLRDGAGNPRRE